VPAATQVASCEKTHSLSGQSQKVETVATASPLNDPTAALVTDTFSSCDRPAPAWADADGYSQIVVTQVTGPGTSNAEGDDFADRVTGPCKAFELQFTWGHMGSTSTVGPFRLPVGMITEAAPNPGTAWTGDRSKLVFYPAPNEADVLLTDDYVVDRATCAP
jgi:hypothetical protein